MTRSLRFWLVTAVATLLVANFVWSWWQDRGLITIHANEESLGKVVDSIAWQGGIKLATNLDRGDPITLHFDKVPLTDALERLAGATDARWTLAYLYAPSQPAIRDALASFSSGHLPENWRMFRMPMVDLIADEDFTPPDPRSLRCEPDAPAEPKLHAYLNSFSQSTDAAALAPNDWNPDISRTLKEELTPKVAQMIARSTKSELQETFILMGFPERPEPTGEPPAEGTRQARWRQGGGQRREFNPEAMAKRVEQQIAQLPKDRQAQVRAEIQAERAFWEEVRALPEEERRKKIEEHVNDPAFQERMARRQDYRDARSSPEKRFERYKRYQERKSRAQQAATQ